jgi:hypothetical protein
MASFLVSYDLIKGKDYDKIINELKRMSGHRALLSAWLVDYEGTVKELFERLSKHFVDDDDRLVVALINPKYVKAKAIKGTNAWLTERA